LNEPDEDLERHVPEEPLPERDVLLEALVDAETETKPRRRFSKTLIAACVFSGLGVWQIVHVSKGGEPIFQLAPKAKAAPTKLRSEGRESIGRVLQSTDPIAAYLERAKRGMTDQEIRWMIEDFQTAGLDGNKRLEKGDLPAKQQLWYLEALSEALQLSPEQKAQARAKMDALLAADLSEIEKKAEEENPHYTSSSPGLRNWLKSTYLTPEGKPSWLFEDKFAPWNICRLAEGQDRLTLHRWYDAEKTTYFKGKDFEEGDPFAPHWIKPSRLAIQDPSTENLTEFPNPDEPASVISDSDPFDGIIQSSDLFPLTPDQKLSEHRFDLLAQARLLQPAQLRMGLILDASLAVDLLERLDSPTAKEAPIEAPSIILERPEEPAPNSTSADDDLPPNPVQPETPVDPLPEPDPK
jgi:hypothetical protein